MLARRHAVAHHQRIGIKRRRGGRLVLDAVGDGEHELVVDRDLAREDEAMAVVPLQRHRLARREHRAALQRPHRVVVRQRLVHARRIAPAEIDEIGIVGALGRQQHDLRALLVGGLVIIFQAQIVEARALQHQRAVDRRRVDLDARAAGPQRHIARQMRRARRRPPADPPARRDASVPWRAAAFARLSAFICGPATKYCQPNRTAADSSDGQDEIAIVVHRNLFGRYGIEARRTAEPGNGMTARKPPEREAKALQRAVHLDRLDRIVRAGRLETAGRRKQRRDERAIEADRRDQRRHRQPRSFSSVRSTGALLARPSFTWAARNACARSASRLSNGLVTVSRRATNT